MVSGIASSAEHLLSWHRNNPASGAGNWLPAMRLIANAKNGISSYELHRALGVTHETAWFMLHRIRLTMQAKTFEKLSGEIEANETFIGGLARNMHKDVRARKITGTGGAGKAVVMGLLKRHGEKDGSTALVVPEPFSGLDAGL